MTGAFFYLAVCVAFLARASVIGHIAEALPNWLRLVALTAVGPVVLLADGTGAWKWFVTVVAIVSISLVLSHFSKRRWPDSEFFVVWLAVALATWAASGWLVIVLAE